MAWLKSHQTLARHPKTLRLSRILGVPVPHVIGALHLLWWWCLDYAKHGDLTGHTSTEIADAATWTGDADAFVEALVVAGFLDRASNEAHGRRTTPTSTPHEPLEPALSVHDWPEYAGEYLRQVKRNSARAAGAIADATLTRAKSRQNRVTVGQEERRGEESREEGGVGGATESPAPLTLVAPDPPSARRRAGGDEGFEKFWAAYPVKAGKANALRAWKGLSEADKAIATEKAAVYARLTVGATAIKYAQGWLNGRRWEDDPETWKRLGRPLDGARPASPPPLPYDPIANEARKRKMLGLDP